MIVVVLAAGKGSRMKSDLPKPLLCVDGQPMLSHVLNTSFEVESNPLLYRVVYGYGKEHMLPFLKERKVGCVEQREQLGTGHAVRVAMDSVVCQEDPAGSNLDTLILYGDVPLLKPETLKAFVSEHQSSDRVLSVMTSVMDDPTGYGRVVRSAHNEVMGIVEEKDATTFDKSITEVNTGIMIANTRKLKSWCRMLKDENAQGEYYLTDVVKIAAAEGGKVGTFVIEDNDEVKGANMPEQLDELSELLKAR